MATGSHSLDLLPRDALVKTGDVDHADWNYRPILGTISRARFTLIRRLLAGTHCERLLEIGYGSGIFMPEFSKYTEKLFGADIHSRHQAVTEKLAEAGIDAELVSVGAESMPWGNNSLDSVVAVSALEFVTDLDEVCKEVSRLLRPKGRFFVVTPGKSPILDFGLKILTGKSAKEDFADRRELILPTLYNHFEVKRKITFPGIGSSIVNLYTAFELAPKTTDRNASAKSPETL